MKPRIIAAVLALAGLVLFGYGIIDVRDFGFEMHAVYAITSGAVSILLACSMIFSRARNNKKETTEPVIEHRRVRAPEQQGSEKKPRSGFALAAAILAVIGAVIPGLFYAGNFAGDIAADPIGGIFWAQFFWGLVGCACLFAGYFRCARWAVLVGSICECLAAVCWLLWVIFYVLPIVFGFIGYAKMKKQAVKI